MTRKEIDELLEAWLDTSNGNKITGDEIRECFKLVLDYADERVIPQPPPGLLKLLINGKIVLINGTSIHLN